MRDLLDKEENKTSETLTCLKEVNLRVTSSCHTENQIKLNIKNNNWFDYDTSFFTLQITRQGNTITVPTNWHSTLYGFEQKQFIVDIDNPYEIDQAAFIPKIKQEKGYCLAQAVKFKPENEC